MKVLKAMTFSSVQRVHRADNSFSLANGVSQERLEEEESKEEEWKFPPVVL